MRTTIRIDDDLYRRAKSHAGRTGQTVSEVIEDAVRAALEPRRRTDSPAPELPTYGGTGVLPGVDLADARALRERMDEHEPVDALR